MAAGMSACESTNRSRKLVYFKFSMKSSSEALQFQQPLAGSRQQLGFGGHHG